MSPSRAGLQSILEACGVHLDAGQIDRLWAYHGMLRAANVDLNMTRIYNFENMVLKHYVDSLLVLRFAELPSPLVDMGSGPGLPGVPLKIARPGVKMILAEPRGGRAMFLEQVVARLRLEDTEVYAGRVGPRFPHRAAGVITRAVASIPETLERVAPALSLGGQMLLMKGPECDAEIAEAERSQSRLFVREADHSYMIPGTSHARRLVVYRRLAGEAPAMVEVPRTFEGQTREVASEANPTFRLARDLLTGKGVRKHGRALLSGQRPVAEVLRDHPEHAEGWLTGPDGPPPPTKELLWVRLAAPLFRELDASGTNSPILMLKVPPIPAWSDDDPWPAGCTLFVPFQDPENVGAVLRSASAFGVSRVVLLRESSHPFHPKALRAGGMSALQIPLYSGPSIEELASAHAPMIGLSGEGEDLRDSPFPACFGLVPGVEGPGLPGHLRSGEVRRIPIAEGVESLNAATAAAIALYAWRSQSGG